jgi:hypothetical protein
MNTLNFFANKTNELLKFDSKSQASDAINGFLIDLQESYGKMVKSGTAHGGSELAYMIKENPIPENYKVLMLWAQYSQRNEKGNLVSRTATGIALFKNK